MYSPHMGQSQSVERSMHLCELWIEVVMQARHVCPRRQGQRSVGAHETGRAVRTLQWKKSLPRPSPRRQMPQSLQW